MGSGVPLTIRVAFQSLLTSLLGSWVTLKLGLKQKEWGVLLGKCMWPSASPMVAGHGRLPPSPPLRGPGGPGEPGEGSDPSPQETEFGGPGHQTPGCSGNRGGETLWPLLGSSDPILPCLSPPT